MELFFARLKSAPVDFNPPNGISYDDRRGDEEETERPNANGDDEEDEDEEVPSPSSPK